MAVYPELFGHIELPDLPGARRDVTGRRAIGVRLVRPVAPCRDHRSCDLRGRA